MKTYYHWYPTCPSCHEPFINGYPLMTATNSIRCTSPDCGARFSLSIDLDDDAVRTHPHPGHSDGESQPRACPLCWKIAPNCIEQSYLDWVKTDQKGNFLITWPWPTAKFAGLLASEWLLGNPEGKAVVIGPLSAFGDKREIRAPMANESLDYLASLEEMPVSDSGQAQSLSKALKKALKSTLHKRPVAVVHFKHVGYGGDASEEVFPEATTECAERLLTEQGDAIRELTVDGRKVLVNPEGSYRVSIKQREQRIGSLAYSRDWLVDVLVNFDRLCYPSETLKPASIRNLEELEEADLDRRLFFVTEPSKTLPASEILRFTRRIGAGLVIIQDSDHFIKDNYLWNPGEKSSEMKNFLQSNEDSCVLMFSPNPDFRVFYRMKWSSRNFVKESNIVVHTWDTQTVLEQITQTEWTKQSEHPNPICSTSREMREPQHVLPADYESVADLDNLSQLVDTVVESLPGDNGRKLVGDYFKCVAMSPLLLQGDYSEDVEILSRQTSHGTALTYDQTANILSPQFASHDAESLQSFLVDKYGLGTDNQKNPLLEEIEKMIQGRMGKGAEFVTIVVHGRDVKGTKSLLRRRGYGEILGTTIDVVKWDNLQLRQRDIGRRARHVVICTLPPVQTFPILDGIMNEYVFVGSSESNRKSKTRIEKRLIEENSRPYQLLDDSDPTPYLLIEIQKRVGLAKEDYKDFSKDYSEETVLRLDWTAVDRGIGATTTVESLPPGSKAILASNAEEQGILLPKSASPMIRTGQNLEIIQFSESDSLEQLKTLLLGKELLIDRRGLSTIYQPIFLKGVLRLGRNITIDTGIFRWKGMRTLYEDAIRWNTILESAAGQIAAQKKMLQNEADIELSEILAQSDLSAKNPEYIVSWWRNYDSVEIDENSFYRLYSVGHPRTMNDMKKIFKVVATIIGGLGGSEENDAERCWTASNIFQNLRDAVLKEKEDIVESLRLLVPPIKEELRNSLDELEFMKVVSVETVTINKGTNAYEKLTCEQIRSMISDNTMTLTSHG